MVFPVVMYGCESWTVKKADCRKIDAFELWCWRRLLKVPWTSTRSYKSILKKISPGCSLEGLMLKLKLQYFGHLMQRVDLLEKTLILGGTGGRRRRGRQSMRWLDGTTDWWAWVWGNSGNLWWIGRPGVLRSMGSQRVRHDWVTELSDWGRKKVGLTYRWLFLSEEKTGSFSIAFGVSGPTQSCLQPVFLFRALSCACCWLPLPYSSAVCVTGMRFGSSVIVTQETWKDSGHWGPLLDRTWIDVLLVPWKPFRGVRQLHWSVLASDLKFPFYTPGVHCNFFFFFQFFFSTNKIYFC